MQKTIPLLLHYIRHSSKQSESQEREDSWLGLDSVSISSPYLVKEEKELTEAVCMALRGILHLLEHLH